MDINANAEVKVYGAQQAVPAVEREQQVKPQVPPVQAGSESEKTALNDRALRDEKNLSRETLAAAVEQVQQRLDSIGSTLKLGFHEDTQNQGVIVQIKDRQTDEVVRQIPPETVIELRAKLEDLVGVLFNETA